MRAHAVLLLLVAITHTTSVRLPVLTAWKRGMASSVAAVFFFPFHQQPAFATDAPAVPPAKAAPALYGIKKDRLLPCKSKSNCFSSSSISSLEHYGKPWAFNGASADADAEFAKLVTVLETIKEFPLNVVEKDAAKRYVRAETRSAIPPTGTDDLEFLVNGLDNIITYRSNSREVVMAGPENIGDGGSNKNRLDVVRRKLGVDEMGVAATDDERDLYKVCIMNAWASYASTLLTLAL